MFIINLYNTIVSSKASKILLCFSRSLRVFLLLRCQKMLPSAIVNCDKNLFFFHQDRQP